MELFISTATDKIYLMTFKDKKIIKKVIHQGNNNHTESFYDLIKQLVSDLTVLKKIYIINGPGSYTGLRVGVIFAKTVCLELNIKLYELNLLEVLFYTNKHQKVAVDAKGKKYYTFDGINHQLVPLEGLETNLLIDPVINLEQLLKTDILNGLEVKNPIEFGINYVKSAI